MFGTKLYAQSPIWLQEILISARSRIRGLLREEQQYRGYYHRAIAREDWTTDQLGDYQLRQLRRIIGHAERHVPYYAGAFELLRPRAEELDCPGDISRLPILDKQTVKKVGTGLLSRNMRFGRIKSGTSGTTGTPLTIYQDLNAIRREHAFVARQRAWAGYREGEPQAWIRGDMIVAAAETGGPFWRFDGAGNTLMMSSYHLSERTAPLYLAALTRLAPTMIQAFPTSVSFLARYLRECNKQFECDSLRAIITSSEALPDEDRRVIEDRFHCRVFDWYGSLERVAAVGTCEQGSLHLLTDYSYVELLPVGENQFEIIGTGFNNYLMPLIRYRIGDCVEMPEDPQSCACNRNFPVVTRVLGRQDDYIKLSDGRHIARLGYIFQGVGGIMEAQIVQEELEEIRVRVVPFGRFSDENRRILVANARARTSPGMRVEVEVVKEIERTRSGKFRTIVSKVP